LLPPEICRLMRPHSSQCLKSAPGPPPTRRHLSYRTQSQCLNAVGRSTSFSNYLLHNRALLTFKNILVFSKCQLLLFLWTLWSQKLFVSVNIFKTPNNSYRTTKVRCIWYIFISNCHLFNSSLIMSLIDFRTWGYFLCFKYYSPFGIVTINNLSAI